MKKFATIFLLFIISIQCLPVKEMGKCLFNNTFVEEESCKHSIEKKQSVTDLKDVLCTNIHAPLVVQRADHFTAMDTDLQTSPVPDVTTPPPNA